MQIFLNFHDVNNSHIPEKLYFFFVQLNSHNPIFAVTIGKNQKLKHERVKWKSDLALTDGQLRSKRDEFWDTAPAFEGRREIWDALKAASYAAETSDYTLAQAIVDGASISLPNGWFDSIPGFHVWSIVADSTSLLPVLKPCF